MSPKGVVDAALEAGGRPVERVVVLQRGSTLAPMTAGRDIGWDEFLAHATGHECGPVPMEANEPAYILATWARPPSPRASPSGTGATTGSGSPSQRVYYTGDSTHLDEDGYVWFAGRADEIIKIAGHRIGTIEVETALLKHPAVAEAAVTGRPGEVRASHQRLRPSEALRRALLDTARRELGPVVVIGELNFVSTVPKTRSGKIVRCLLRTVILEKDPGDVSTIEHEGSIDEAREAWRQIQAEIRAGR